MAQQLGCNAQLTPALGKLRWCASIDPACPGYGPHNIENTGLKDLFDTF